MKLNFWQIIGLICLIVGVIGYALTRGDKKTRQPANTPSPAQTTQP